MPSLAPLDASMIESLARRSDDNLSHGEGGLRGAPTSGIITAQPVQASDCAGMDTVHHGYLKNSSS
jgi:hypothetical protein